MTRRDWSTVKESLRRERHVHDLLARSGSTRLHQRVTLGETGKPEWTRTEQGIVDAERSLRVLDQAAPDFWIEFRECEDRLIKLFHDARVTFEG